QSVVPFPRLSLVQYASLRAELSVWPEHASDIRLRYHVMNEAARRALDEHWQMQLAASPEMRAQLEKAIELYTAWPRTWRRWPVAIKVWGPDGYPAFGAQSPRGLGERHTATAGSAWRGSRLSARALATA